MILCYVKVNLETAEMVSTTKNVLDCDQSNYSSRIIFSYTFALEPNTNWTGWTDSEIQQILFARKKHINTI